MGGTGTAAAEPLQKSARSSCWYCSVASVEGCECTGGMGEGGTAVTLEAMLNGRIRLSAVGAVVGRPVSWEDDVPPRTERTLAIGLETKENIVAWMSGSVA